MAFLRDLLLDPRIRNGSLDDDGLLEAHERIVREKRLLRSAFLTFYATLTRHATGISPSMALSWSWGAARASSRKSGPGSSHPMCAKASISTVSSMRWQWIFPMTAYGASMPSMFFIT